MQLRKILQGLSGSTLCASLVVTSSFAQTPLVQTADEYEDPICMVRLSSAEPIGSSGAGRSIVIAVVLASVPEAEARGFAVRDCAQNGLQTPADLARYRDQVCKLARLGNDAVQAQITRNIGEQPSVLCANAEKIAGPWDQRTADTEIPSAEG